MNGSRKKTTFLKVKLNVQKTFPGFAVEDHFLNIIILMELSEFSYCLKLIFCPFRTYFKFLSFFYFKGVLFALTFFTFFTKRPGNNYPELSRKTLYLIECNRIQLLCRDLLKDWPRYCRSTRGSPRTDSRPRGVNLLSSALDWQFSVGVQVEGLSWF